MVLFLVKPTIVFEAVNVYLVESQSSIQVHLAWYHFLNFSAKHTIPVASHFRRPSSISDKLCYLNWKLYSFWSNAYLYCRNMVYNHMPEELSWFGNPFCISLGYVAAKTSILLVGYSDTDYCNAATYLVIRCSFIWVNTLSSSGRQMF